MRLLLQLLLCLHLLMPIAAWAQAKDPLSYPLKTYGFMLAIALLGGLVSWITKVRNGDAKAWNVMHLIGELCTSAFAGLLAFWLCEASGITALWTAPLVGISGHMGTRAISAFETWAAKKWGAVIEQTPPQP